MCKKWFEQHLGEIPPLLMNVFVIVLIIVDFCLIFKGGYPSDIRVALIHLFGILIGTLVVGNSIIYLRSKTVQNELIRSNIDIINHCITNKKLKIEMYHAVLSVKHNSGVELKKEETTKAKKEGDEALEEYNKRCEELKKICDGAIEDKTFEKALKCLKEQICQDKNN